MLAARVCGYTGFFIGGGDQSRYSDILIKSDGKTDTALISSGNALTILGTNTVDMFSLKDVNSGTASDWSINTVR
jgi:hypothetical protein